MLLRTVSLKRMVSCVTLPICSRKESEAHVAQIVSVDGDAARGHVEEARDEIDERRLPCPAGPDQRDHFAVADVEIDVVQNFFFAFVAAVGKADIFKPDGIAKALQVEGVLPLDDFVLVFHEIEDGL